VARFGFIGLGTPTVAEEDYLGAARSLRAMVDILGPVAALLLQMGARAPSILVRPYNRMRDQVILHAMQLLAEARTFVESSGTIVTRTDRWVALGTRLEPDLLPALILPTITTEWLPMSAPPFWNETTAPVGEHWRWSSPTELANRAIAGYTGQLPTIVPNAGFVINARYGSGSLPTASKWIGALIPWIIYGAWEIGKTIVLFSSAADVGTSNPPSDVTPAVDAVATLRRRFEQGFMAAIYQPIRAAAKILSRTGGATELTGSAMYETDPRATEPPLPAVWDGTFGFGNVTGPNESTSSGWTGPLLVGGAVALAVLLMSGDW
jgi:hypothetical protein